MFLDAFGMPYAYESEGFDLGKLGWYLPDFYLPQTATWIEVKPVEPTADARLKAKMLTLAREQYVDIVVGTPEFTTGDWFGTGQVLHCYPGSVPPGKQDWCPLRLVAFYWSGETHIDGPWGEAAIAYAVEQARTARFEHGEVPHVYNAWKRARYEHHGAIWTEKADEDSPTNTPIVDAWVLPDEANL